MLDGSYLLTGIGLLFENPVIFFPLPFVKLTKTTAIRRQLKSINRSFHSPENFTEAIPSGNVRSTLNLGLKIEFTYFCYITITVLPVPYKNDR